MKVKVKKRNDPNEQLKPCMFIDSCFGACVWCETHDYSEACVPMLQQRIAVQRVAIEALKKELTEAKQPQAGCEYCSGKFAEYQHTVNTRLAISTFGKARTIETECNPCPPYANCSMKGVPVRSAFLINYCPNCGRNLKAGDDNE